MAEAETKKKPKHQLAQLNAMRGDIPGEIVREGITVPWMVSERAVQALKDYEVRDDDVWITTYPKAGTHWAVEITNLILADGEEEKINRKKQPTPIEFDFAQPGVIIPPESPPHMREPLYEKCKSWPSPRVFMTHLPENWMPKQIYEGKGKDLRGAVVQMADFLGRPLSDEAIERIVKLSTLDSMKQRFKTADDTSGKGKIGAPDIIRKGIVGDWKTQFTVAQNDTFDEVFRERMKGSDLHIDFEVKKYFSTVTIMTS